MNNEYCLVLLAGGKSTRMGQVKGLLRYGEKYWIEEQIKRFEMIGGKVFIGLGYDFEKYFEAIPLLKSASFEEINIENVTVQVIVNPHPENGPFSTLKCVLNEIHAFQKIFIQPIDVPLTNCLQKIIDIENEVVIPQYFNQNGHPVLISSSVKDKLLKINELDEHARLDFQIKKFRPELVTHIDLNDEQVTMNINKIEDWNHYVETYFHR